MAIVGMAGRFPGANEISEIWEMLMEQKSGISETESRPADSLDVGERFIHRYGSLDKVGAFDAKFWGMSEDEACNLDPQVCINPNPNPNPSTFRILELTE